MDATNDLRSHRNITSWPNPRPSISDCQSYWQ